MAGTVTIKLILTCIQGPRCNVYFEPEGAEMVLEAGDVFTVEMEGAGPGVPEISYLPSGISICAWDRAETRAWNRAGERLKI